MATSVTDRQQTTDRQTDRREREFAFTKDALVTFSEYEWAKNAEIFFSDIVTSFSNMADGKRTHNWKMLGNSMLRVVWFLGHIKQNSNCYNYVVGVDLFSSNNIYIARCSRDTGSKYGSQESGSTRVAMVFLHTYVANGGLNKLHRLRHKIEKKLVKQSV